MENKFTTPNLINDDSEDLNNTSTNANGNGNGNGTTTSTNISGTTSNSTTSTNTNTINTAPSTIINSITGLSLKTFYYLISTMNNMFPDYDFSDIPPESFIKITSLSSLINHFNTSIFNTGIDRNTKSFSDFTRQMWDCMNEAVGGLDESLIFSFNPEPYEIDDPFRERGTM